MSTEIVKHVPAPPVRLSSDELKFIQNSNLLPAAYRGKPADIFACVLLGRQLGIGDMHALRSIYVVDGKATIGAELMVTLVRRAGHSITADYGEGVVTVTGTRDDNGDVMSVTWTLDMARRAGLLEKQNWKRYPEAMLWARAVSQLCRMLFADVLSGMVYTPDEAELSPADAVDAAIGELAPPPDTHEPDDTPRDSSDRRADSRPEADVPAGGGSDDQAPGMGARTPAPPPDDLDEPEPDVVDVEPVLVDEPEEEPRAAQASSSAVPAVAPAAAPPAGEPASSSGNPAAGRTDAPGQGSIFEQMAEGAQSRRRSYEREDDA